MHTLDDLLSKFAPEPITKAANAPEAVTAKVAEAAPAPVVELEKLATKVATDNRKEELAHAEELGRLIYQGFLKEAQAYEAAVKQVYQEKVAELGPTPAELDLLRLLREDPRGFLDWATKEAQAATGSDDAQARFQAGYNDEIQKIHKEASDHYRLGYGAMDEYLALLAKQQEATAG